MHINKIYADVVGSMVHVISQNIDGGATEADGCASAPVGPSVAMPLKYGLKTEEVGCDVSATKNISIFEYVCTLLTCSTVRSRSFERLMGFKNWYILSNSTSEF